MLHMQQPQMLYSWTSSHLYARHTCKAYLAYSKYLWHGTQEWSWTLFWLCMVSSGEAYKQETGMVNNCAVVKLWQTVVSPSKTLFENKLSHHRQLQVSNPDQSCLVGTTAVVSFKA